MIPPTHDYLGVDQAVAQMVQKYDAQMTEYLKARETRQRPFVKSNFVGETGTWTVAAVNIVSDTYRVQDGTLFYSVRLESTTTAGGVTTCRVALPGGYVAAETMADVGIVSDDGATFYAVRVAVTSGGTFVRVVKFDGTAIANATGQVFVAFQIMLKVTG